MELHVSYCVYSEISKKNYVWWDEERFSRNHKVSNFTYHNGLLKTITTNDGRKLSYEYAGKLLVRVDMQNNTSIHYEYDSIGNIISITDQNGHKHITNE